MATWTPLSKNSIDVTWANTLFTWANISQTWAGLSFWIDQTKN